MIDVNTFDINDPRRAKMLAICEKQAEAYEALQGGENPIVGHSYDVWNTLGIPWSMYNYYHELGWSDEDIKTHRDNLLKIAPGNYPETDKIRAYQKKLDNAVWYY